MEEAHHHQLLIKEGSPSEVWKEMRKYKDRDGNNNAECIHCKKSFDGSSQKGTAHLKNHLDRCPANPKRKGPDGRNGDDQDQLLSPPIKTKELASLIKEKSVYDLIKHFSNIEGDKDWDPSSVLNSRKDEILQLYQEEKEKLCQFLNSLSCRFSLQLTCCKLRMYYEYFLVVHYIDDSWERQSKVISCWKDPFEVEDSMKAVQQSCLDWKIDKNICFLLLPCPIRPADDRGNQIGKTENWFSQRRSPPFAGFIHDGYQLMGYIRGTFENYARDGILRAIRQCVDYVYNKSTSDKPIQLDSAVKKAISKLERASLFWHFDYLRTVAKKCLKKVSFLLEQLDSDFRSIKFTKQKWDEITATFEHLKLLKYVGKFYNAVMKITESNTVIHINIINYTKN